MNENRQKPRSVNLSGVLLLRRPDPSVLCPIDLWNRPYVTWSSWTRDKFHRSILFLFLNLHFYLQDKMQWRKVIPSMNSQVILNLRLNNPIGLYHRLSIPVFQDVKVLRCYHRRIFSRHPHCKFSDFSFTFIYVLFLSKIVSENFFVKLQHSVLKLCHLTLFEKKLEKKSWIHSFHF